MRTRKYLERKQERESQAFERSKRKEGGVHQKWDE